MISCLIWPSINSWRHHNGLRTQNSNLHIMTSAYLWKIDCISVNIDRFSSKCWYVLAETIFYKCSYYYPSFWHVNVLHFACTGILYGTWLFLKTRFYIPVFRGQYLRRFSFIYAEIRVCCSWDKKLSQMYPLFGLNFLLDQPTYTCFKQVLQILFIYLSGWLYIIQITLCFR